MTPTQKAFFKNVSQAAHQLSKDAEAELVSFLDSENFKSSFRRMCPGCQDTYLNAAGSDLMKFLKEEMALVEFVHNFPARPSRDSQMAVVFDMNIDECLYNTTYFLNAYQIANKKLQNITFAEPSPADYAERELFHCPPIVDLNNPSFQEANERPQYTAVNWFKFDTGNAQFGDISVIFQPSYVKQMGYMVPMDTGLYEMGCNPEVQTGSGGPFANEMNCSAWVNQIIGTATDFVHLVLPSARFWNGTHGTHNDVQSDYYTRPSTTSGGGNVIPETAEDRMGKLFGRLFGYWAPNLTATMHVPTMPLVHEEQILRYPEYDLGGQVFFDEGIKFIVANFAYNFGNVWGEKVREWCSMYNYTLVWALGMPENQDATERKSNKGFLSNNRVIDPTMSSYTNFSASAQALQSFRSLWDIANKSHPSSQDAMPSNLSQSLWKQIDHSLFVQPLRRLGCASKTAADDCIGITVLTNDCICKLY